ncbi:MAG: ornithine cyclodeaminase family protein, partial [Candidatus Omnitrophica bacterium]|nr:ornithine cyclodeaminase family protein [Candidatus Omnitrophota bacterium]
MKKNLYQTLILTRPQIEKLINLKQAIVAVEEAFQEYAMGRAQMPPKIYLDLKEYGGDLRAMPVYLSGAKSCGIKWVNSHSFNRKYGLPAVMAVFILNDPRTGFPLSIMDATYLTALRTSAGSAVATKYLARRNSSVVSLVGCGIQAQYQIQALRQVMSIKDVRVWGFQE